MIEHTFPGQRANEKVLAWIHKHWITYFKILLYTIIFGAIFTLVLTWLFGRLFAGTAGLNYALLFLTLYLLSVWIWAFVSWLDDEFDVFILTDQRMIDITQNGLFKISFSETSLDLIQDVHDSSSGFFGNILGYGNVEAQTAASNIVFQFDHIGNPNEISKLIQQAKHDFLVRNGKSDSSQTEMRHSESGLE
jgi:hypothetical protein